jgi:hypothetical protein
MSAESSSAELPTPQILDSAGAITAVITPTRTTPFASRTPQNRRHVRQDGRRSSGTRPAHGARWDRERRRGWRFGTLADICGAYARVGPRCREAPAAAHPPGNVAPLTGRCTRAYETKVPQDAGIGDPARQVCVAHPCPIRTPASPPPRPGNAGHGRSARRSWPSWRARGVRPRSRCSCA